MEADEENIIFNFAVFPVGILVVNEEQDFHNFVEFMKVGNLQVMRKWCWNFYRKFSRKQTTPNSWTWNTMNWKSITSQKMKKKEFEYR